MKFSTCFALILLGSGSVATAQPAHEETSGRVSYTGKHDTAHDAPRRDDGWIELATPTPAKHGSEFVVVDPDTGSVAKLRIDLDDGTVVVRKIRIFFADGQQQTFNIEHVLDRRRSSLVLGLKQPKPIDHIVVTTGTQTTGSYSIYGSPGTAAR